MRLNSCFVGMIDYVGFIGPNFNQFPVKSSGSHFQAKPNYSLCALRYQHDHRIQGIAKVHQILVNDLSFKIYSLRMKRQLKKD